ncbi:hypothetical protein DK28_0208705 [Peptococcaceae bacterium SCADC1_2_3]|nr:hypothetical protein DK28_0208705 [Peptococcaceae bacterium SCADC1_2_3]KFI36118.1 hypothetical protein HY00_07500 [Peptococcaceae bacterium SCADC1_2_3]
MARRCIPPFSSLWQKHETLYIGIFIVALQRLSEDKCDTANEDIISEHLCPILNTVCFEKSRNNNCEIRTPDWEKPIQPVSDSELKGGKVRKRPDFTCKLTNPFADCPSEHEIPFHIECKRLGSPTSANWILNKNYVTNGIKRFDCRSHEYGKRASSGMMVGYIISMSPEKILDEVNTRQKQHCHYNPAVEFKFVKENVQQYRQELNRKNLKPEMFKLIHLWVDLRSQ